MQCSNSAPADPLHHADADLLVDELRV